MRTKMHALGAIIAPLWGTTAFGSDCPPGTSLHVVDGVKKCVVDSGVVVVIDPDWLVAGAVALAVIMVATVYTAVKVTQMSRR